MSPASAPRRTETIAAMPRYHPHRPPTRVDLSDNTSLWGPPPSVRATLAALSDAQLSRYPTPYADALTGALASHHGVGPERVVTGCGSDDVLDSAIRACCDAGSSIGVAVPTFSVIASFAAVNDVEVRGVELRRDGTISADDLLASGADIYYVCSPNNPTGTCAQLDELRGLLSGTSATVLLDEAYADFADHDATALLDEFDNLVVVRTLSKAYGLAGLRVGYGIGHPDVIAAIAISRGPYKVSGIAEAVAIGVLERDGDWVHDRVIEMRALRDDFTARLVAQGLDALRSEANFVAVLVDDATKVRDQLLAAGVLARAYTSLPVFGDLVRVTIGPRAQLDEAFELLIGSVR
ncbi:MAG TPA: histidinol-phosphate transaminase [Acidimicrobiales bacterium]|nr:histidinol-phosphate transaminase [Acidimicrobiales bacterium]